MIFFVLCRHEKGSIVVLLGKYMTIMAFLLCFLGLVSTFTVRICDYFTIVNILLLSYYLPRANQIWRFVTISLYIFYWTMTIVVANFGDTYSYSSRILESII